MEDTHVSIDGLSDPEVISLVSNLDPKLLVHLYNTSQRFRDIVLELKIYWMFVTMIDSIMEDEPVRLNHEKIVLKPKRTVDTWKIMAALNQPSRDFFINSYISYEDGSFQRIEGRTVGDVIRAAVAVGVYLDRSLRRYIFSPKISDSDVVRLYELLAPFPVVTRSNIRMYLGKESYFQ